MRRVTASLQGIVAGGREEAVADSSKPGNLTEMIFDPPPIFAPPAPEPESEPRNPLWRAIAAKFRRPPPEPAGLPDARVARVALRRGV